MDSYIQSSEFDLQFGNRFAFVNRILPDVTFRQSTATSPQVTMTLIPMQNSGSGYNTPQSTTGSTNIATITRTATSPIEKFTGQVFIRLRGRQMIFQIEGNQLGLQWQLGTPRIEIKPDGRRGNTWFRISMFLLTCLCLLLSTIRLIWITWPRFFACISRATIMLTRLVWTKYLPIKLLFGWGSNGCLSERNPSTVITG